MNVLTVILALQTAIVVVAGIFLLLALRRVQKTTEHYDALLRSMEPKLTEIVEDINQLVKSSQPVGRQLVDIGANVKEIVESAKNVTQSVADIIEDTSSKARVHIARVDTIVADTVEKTEVVTHSLSENLFTPLMEISALIKGVRVAVKYVRSRHIREG